MESQEEVAPIFPFPAGVIRILPDEELLEGSIVAFRILHLDQRALILGVWQGPTGRGDDARFVPKGSADEYYSMGWFKYCQRDLDKGLVTILGVVDLRGAALPVA